MILKKEIKNNENIEINEPKVIINGINILEDKKDESKVEKTKQSGVIFKKLLKSDPLEEIKIKPRKLKTKLFFGKSKLETIKENIKKENNNIEIEENKNKENENKEDIKDNINNEKKELSENNEFIEKIIEEKSQEDSINKEKEEKAGNTQGIDINKQINKDEDFKKEDIHDNEEK